MAELTTASLLVSIGCGIAIGVLLTMVILWHFIKQNGKPQN